MKSQDEVKTLKKKVFLPKLRPHEVLCGTNTDHEPIVLWSGYIKKEEISHESQFNAYKFKCLLSHIPLAAIVICVLAVGVIVEVVILVAVMVVNTCNLNTYVNK